MNNILEILFLSMFMHTSIMSQVVTIKPANRIPYNTLKQNQEMLVLFVHSLTEKYVF